MARSQEVAAGPRTERRRADDCDLRRGGAARHTKNAVFLTVVSRSCALRPLPVRPAGDEQRRQTCRKLSRRDGRGRGNSGEKTSMAAGGGLLASRFAQRVASFRVDEREPPSYRVRRRGGGHRAGVWGQWMAEANLPVACAGLNGSERPASSLLRPAERTGAPEGVKGGE
ncbi:hypothetical protein GY45DRAFT_323691 [Cubamyces sp. BRFM 1775]|nr:hypothetical protein GY45DRAFT_323691 [Cubamyces sp. BRFM 1775]